MLRTLPVCRIPVMVVVLILLVKLIALMIVDCNDGLAMHGRAQVACLVYLHRTFESCVAWVAA